MSFRGGNLTHPMLITAFYLYLTQGHREPHNRVGSLSLEERQSALRNLHRSMLKSEDIGCLSRAGIVILQQIFMSKIRKTHLLH